MEKIEDEGFIINNMIKRELIKEEISNLYYKHLKKDYFQQILDYLLEGESLILLICHVTEDPIKKWKKIIGNMDPIEAKVKKDQFLIH